MRQWLPCDTAMTKRGFAAQSLIRASIANRSTIGANAACTAASSPGKRGPAPPLKRASRSLAADEVACVLDMPAHGGFGTLTPEFEEELVHLRAGRDGITPEIIAEFCNLMPECGEF